MKRTITALALVCALLLQTMPLALAEGEPVPPAPESTQAVETPAPSESQFPEESPIPAESQRPAESPVPGESQPVEESAPPAEPTPAPEEESPAEPEDVAVAPMAEPLPDPVTFTDAALYEAVLKAGNFTENAAHTLTQAQLQYVGGTIRVKDVTDITPLQYCVNLQNLYIDGGTITQEEAGAVLPKLGNLRILSIQNVTGDFTTLKLGACPSLDTVDLSNCGLTDVSALTGKNTVRYMELDGNTLEGSDLTWLSDVTRLTSLNLSNCGLTALPTLPQLNILYANDNPVEKDNGKNGFTGILSLTKLNTLGLNNTGLDQEDFDTLVQGNPGLLTLSVAGNPDIKKVTGTEGLPGTLQNLDVSGTKFEAAALAAAVSKLSHLYSLDISRTGISDLSFLTTDPIKDSLTTLRAEGNEITDLNPLEEVSNLFMLYLADNNLEDLTGIYHLENLQYLFVRNNKISDLSTLNLLMTMTKLVGVDLRGNQMNLAWVGDLVDQLQVKCGAWGALLSGQNPQPGPPTIPTTQVGDVPLSCVMKASASIATLGDTINVSATLKNESETTTSAPLTFAVALPEGVTLVPESGTDRMENVTLQPEEGVTLTFTVRVANACKVGRLLLKASATPEGGAVKDLNAVSIQVVYVTLNVPYQVWPGTPFYAYGEATPGSKVTIQFAQGEARPEEDSPRWEEQFEADHIPSKDGLYSVRLLNQTTGPFWIRAAVSKDGQTFYSEAKAVGCDPGVVTTKDIYAATKRGTIWPNPYTGIPAFSAWTDSHLIGESFTPHVKFTNPELIQSVTFRFGGCSYPAQHLDNGYYCAAIQGWSTTGVQMVTAEVKQTDGESHTFEVARVTVLIDPSGFVKDPEGNAIAGAKVLLEVQDGEEWKKWDAESHLQTNPILTDETGYYGWDVPAGTYRLQITKQGYEDATITTYKTAAGSESAITIPPVRTDVNVSLTPVPTDPDRPLPQTLEAASAAVAAVVNTAEVTETTDSDALLTAAKAEVTNDAITVTWANEKGLQVVPATVQRNGSVSGALRLYDNEILTGQVVPVEATLLSENAATPVLTAELSGGALTYTLDQSLAGQLIIVFYGDGKCLSVRQVAVPNQSSGTVHNVDVPQGADACKVLLLDSLNGMKPWCPAALVTIS